MRRAHPCNQLGFLYVEPVDYQRAMNQQLRLRDEEVAKDRSVSGEPPAFLKWSLAQVAGLAADDPSIAKQIGSRIADLDDKLTKLEIERQQLAEGLNRQEKELTAQINLLVDLLPPPRP